MIARVAALAVLLAPALARADDGPGDRDGSAATPPVPPAIPAPAAVEDDAPTRAELEQEIDELRTRVKATERAGHRSDALGKVVNEVLLPLSRFMTVWVDVGAFAVGGNGSGIRSDLDHVYYPGYASRIPGQWVFMGDPLSTTINSNGEPADTSSSREIKTDTINSEGRPSLIVNSVGLAIAKDVGHGFGVSSLVELMPRPDHDLLDIELAQVLYRPSEELNLEIEAGKIDSMLGVEYRTQDAPKRLTVTPSLICRYTCGRPLGISARLVRGQLTASAAITNGDNFDQRFEHDELLKANRLPTASGHVQWNFTGIGQGLELGISGAIGPQDQQPDLGTGQWHIGFDAKLTNLAGVDVIAEYVKGLQQGRTATMTPCDVAPCLSYQGGYVLADARVNTHFRPYVRVDWRDAVHQSGVEFVYESHTLRATVGAQLVITSRIKGKIEYTFNRELGPIPEFPDDIFTSSFVVATD